MAMFLVDTNVMLAASAVQELSNLAVRAMPREIELRETIYQWLANFDVSDERIVLDEEGVIRDEYERNMQYNQVLHGQEYGMQVLQNKIDRNLADYVPIDVVMGNGECIATLSQELEALVTDREDRKWVASALATQILHGEMPPIVYGAETDWFIAENGLGLHGICFCRLLPDHWYNERVPAA